MVDTLITTPTIAARATFPAVSVVAQARVGDITAKPYWIQDRQPWVDDHLAVAHNEVLFKLGEYAAFCLMWHPDDFAAGLVQRCLRCQSVVGQAVFDTFKQSYDPKCPDCYGTTFEGGVRGLFIRQSLWTFTEEDHIWGARGEIQPQNASVQVPGDFQMRSGDYIFRGDGNRFQVTAPVETTRMRSGFEVPTGLDVVVGSVAQVKREDASSVAYIIPPLNDVLVPRLQVPYPRYPLDFSDLELVRANGHYDAA